MYNSTSWLCIFVISPRQLYWHAISEIRRITNTSANRNMTVHRMKFLISLILAVSILIIQTGGVFAASALQTSPVLQGTIQSITLETYSTTGITVVIVTLMESDQIFQTIRVDEKSAKDLGLVVFDGDGKLIINESALGQSVEIKPEMILPDHEEDRHPVGNALATYFSNIAGLDYDTIMLAHNDGNGFGVITQALWLTTKLDGNVEVFQALLLAKENGDYKDFIFEDGTVPQNWAELRKGLFDGKKLENLGNVMSNKNHENGNTPEKNKEKNKDKEKNNGDNGKGGNKEKKK